MAKFQGAAPILGYYLFISEDDKYKLEISRNHPVFAQNKPKMKGGKNGKNILLYKISWLSQEKDKKLFTDKDFIEVAEKEETDNEKSTRLLENPK